MPNYTNHLTAAERERLLQIDTQKQALYAERNQLVNRGKKRAQRARNSA